MRRWLPIAFAFLWSNCETIRNPPPELLDCRTLGCRTGYLCEAPQTGQRWVCVAEPKPSPSPTPIGPPVTVPTPQPTPVPTPTPEPTPTPKPPKPSPTPQPCVTGCRPDQWQCKDRSDWEVAQGNWKRLPAGHPFKGIYGCPPGVPEVPGCAGGRCLDSRCDLVDCFTQRVLSPAEDGFFGICVPKPCPAPSPAPSPSPSPGPTPTPGPGPTPGIQCAPLTRMGVARIVKQIKPQTPRGERWVFSATPKSSKPFCPDNRNECEQQAYQGDPVLAYDHVIWRFDLKGECQNPDGPLWVQWEPHTGSEPQNVDAQHLNPYNANLVPQVPGPHTVRACPQGTPNHRGNTMPAGCGETTVVAP